MVCMPTHLLDESLLCTVMGTIIKSFMICADSIAEVLDWHSCSVYVWLEEGSHLTQQYIRTDVLYHSFFPRTISQWKFNITTVHYILPHMHCCRLSVTAGPAITWDSFQASVSIFHRYIQVAMHCKKCRVQSIPVIVNALACRTLAVL